MIEDNVTVTPFRVRVMFKNGTTAVFSFDSDITKWQGWRNIRKIWQSRNFGNFATVNGIVEIDGRDLQIVQLLNTQY